MDIIDAGSEREMADTEAAVRAARAKAERLEAEATGVCLWCGEDLDKGRWCNTECNRDWSRHQEAKRRAGVVE